MYQTFLVIIKCLHFVKSIYLRETLYLEVECVRYFQWLQLQQLPLHWQPDCWVHSTDGDLESIYINNTIYITASQALPKKIKSQWEIRNRKYRDYAQPKLFWIRITNNNYIKIILIIPLIIIIVAMCICNLQLYVRWSIHFVSTAFSSIFSLHLLKPLSQSQMLQ